MIPHPFRFLPALAPLLLSACIEAPAEPPPPDACGAEALQHLAGRPLFALTTPPTGARPLRPGMPMTMDFHADRLNVELDGQDRIARIFCG